MQKIKIQRPMKIMLICVGILFGGIFIYKGIVSLIIKHSMSSNKNPPVTVSTMKAAYANWQPQYQVSGSLRAIKGVNVTTESAGMVQKILFTPGAFVKTGEILVQLNSDAEQGQLRSLEAQLALAKITYERDKAQYAIRAVSKQTVDVDYQNLKSLEGRVAEQTAIVAKKSIRAPFAGRLGISQINPGQYVNLGDKVVSLQTWDPIYVDFFVPQQQLGQIKVGQLVTISSDTYPGKKFKGQITTIDPAVDNTTRNVEMEATIANPKNELMPGMFASVEINLGAVHRYLTLPQAAISYNPYGNLVYVVREKDKQPLAFQAFVITGETRGDQIAILKGLKQGDVVVSSGQLKLKNGSLIKVNNKIVPSNNPNPDAPNEH